MAQASADKEIVIFQSGHEGYGDARRTIRQASYNRVVGNMDLRWPGEALAGASLTSLSGYPGGGFDVPPLPPEQWEDTTPNPILLFSALASGTGGVYRVRGGVIALDVALAATPTGRALHDDGSGVPYYYTCYGAPSGGGTKIQRRNRAGTLSQATNVSADKLLSLNNDLYVTATPTGGTQPCAVGKISAGTDPNTAAMPSLTVVGLPHTPINNLAPDGTGRFPVALKAEGILVYDRGLDLWQRHGRIPYHPDNGKVFWHEGSDLCVALGGGGAVRFTGVSVVPYDPLPLTATPDRSTTTQLIAAAAVFGQYGALLTKPGAKRQRTGGVGSNAKQIDFGKTINAGASYTDYSTVVSDGDPTTTADLATLPTIANNGWLVVGFPEPVVGVFFDLGSVGAVNLNSLTMETLSAGAVWTARAAMDGTNGLYRNGWLLMNTDPIRDGSWTPQSLNVGGAKTRYWIRIGVATALAAGLTCKGLDLLPYRPAVDADAQFLSTFGLDSLDRSGSIPHLLLSRLAPGFIAQHVVHDMGMASTAAVADEIAGVIYGEAGNASANGNDSRGLYVFGMRNAYFLNVAPDDRPQMYAWPALGPYGAVEFPTVDCGGNVDLEAFRVECSDWNATGLLWYRFDDGRPWTRLETFDVSPATLQVPGESSGRRLKVMAGYKLSIAQQRPTQHPRFTKIVAIPKAGGEEGIRLPQQSPPVI